MSANDETHYDALIREARQQQAILQAQIEGWQMEKHYIQTLQAAIKVQEDPILQ